MRRVDGAPEVTRLLILDEVGLYREAVARSLQRYKRFEVVGVAASLGEALAALEDVVADIVLVDMPMPADPDGDQLAFSWTQTAGPQVTLTGANTATPSFTAPVGPATLEFELEVCDPAPLCDTDAVTITILPPIVEEIDAAADVLVHGPTRSAGSRKGFFVRVGNEGTAPFEVSTGDVEATVEVNGVAAGEVSAHRDFTRTLQPGEAARFRFVWSYDGLVEGGDGVVYSACVSVTGDADPTNDCDSETRTAR